jgi:hypothetical protein
VSSTYATGVEAVRRVLVARRRFFAEASKSPFYWDREGKLLIHVWSGPWGDKIAIRDPDTGNYGLMPFWELQPLAPLEVLALMAEDA